MAKALSNSDFRTIMMTPRAGGGESEMSKAPDASSKSGEKKPRKKWRPKVPKFENEGEKVQDNYRDRAKERREGGSDEEGDTYGVDTSKLTEEESKFLGGDIEHTHLVKGLDFALLRKQREEMKREQEAEQAMEEERARIAARTASENAQYDKLSFRTPMARNIHKTLFAPKQQPKSAPADSFDKGRTTLLFSLAPTSSFDLPTVMKTSRHDAEKVKETIRLGSHSASVEKLAEILQYLRQPGAKKKLKKKERDAMPTVSSAPTVTYKAVDADVSIYDDDEITASGPAPGPAMPPSGPAGPGSYFSSSAEDAGSVGPSVGPAPGPAMHAGDGDYGYPEAEMYPEADDIYPNTDAAFAEPEGPKRKREDPVPPVAEPVKRDGFAGLDVPTKGSKKEEAASAKDSGAKDLYSDYLGLGASDGYDIEMGDYYDMDDDDEPVGTAKLTTSMGGGGTAPKSKKQLEKEQKDRLNKDFTQINKIMSKRKDAGSWNKGGASKSVMDGGFDLKRQKLG